MDNKQDFYKQVEQWYDELPQRMNRPPKGERLLNITVHEMVSFMRNHAADYLRQNGYIVSERAPKQEAE